MHVDPYNDFYAEDGRLYPRVREIAESVGLHEHTRELLAATQAAGIRRFIAPHRRWRPGDTDGWQHRARPHLMLFNEHVFADGSYGGQWYPDFAPRDGDVVAAEHWGESGFMHTDLDLQLRQHGIERVILAGMTAPGCVEGTGRWAMELGYGVTLVKDATTSFNAEWMRAAVDLNAQLYAERVLTTADLVAVLKEA